MTRFRVATLNVFTDVPLQDGRTEEDQKRLRLRGLLLQNADADAIMLQEFARPVDRRRIRDDLPDYDLFTGHQYYPHIDRRTGKASIVCFCLWVAARSVAVYCGTVITIFSFIPLLCSLILVVMIVYRRVYRLDSTGLAILVRKKHEAKFVECRAFENRKHIFMDTFPGFWPKLEVLFQLLFLNYGYIRVQTNINGRLVDLISVHLTSPGPKNRGRRSAHYRMLTEMKRDAEVQIIAGDFNTEDPDGLLPLKDYIDCGRNPIATYALLAGEPSDPRRLDRIYCKSCEVISTRLLDDPVCSDHFGVVAELSI